MIDSSARVLSNDELNNKTKYYLSVETLKLWSDVDENGYSTDHNAVYKLLSEDLAYRLHEVVEFAASFMLHSKRTKLKTSDIDSAFEVYKTEKLFGYSSNESVQYEKFDLNGKFRNNFRVKNNTIKLEMPTIRQDVEELMYPCLNGYWTMVNGNIKKPIDSLEFDFDDYNEGTNKLSVDHKRYYDFITSVILNEKICENENDEDNEKLFVKILTDLQTSTKLQPLIPYLLNFFSQAIQNLLQIDDFTTSESFMTNTDYVKRVLDTIRCIILNKNIFLAPKGYFSKLLSCLIFCIIQSRTKNTIFFTNSLLVRETASYLLALLLKYHETYLTDSINYIKEEFFMENLVKNKLNMPEMYGILFTLQFFGLKITSEFYPYILRFGKSLTETSDDDDLYKIITINSCVTFLVKYFKWILKYPEQQLPRIQIARCYSEIYEVFGDRFTLLLPFEETISILEARKQTFRFQVKQRSRNSFHRMVSFKTFEVFENWHPCKEKGKNIFIMIKQN